MEELLRNNRLSGMEKFLKAIQNPANSNNTQYNQILQHLILLIISDSKHDFKFEQTDYEILLSVILSIPGIFATDPNAVLGELLKTPNQLNNITEAVGLFKINLPGNEKTTINNIIGAGRLLGRVAEDAVVENIGGDLHTLLSRGNYGSFPFSLNSDGNTQPWTVTNIRFKETLKNPTPAPQQYIQDEGCVTKPRTSEPHNYDKLYIHDIIQQLLRIAHIVPAAGGVTTYKICLSVDDNTLINKLIENRVAIGQHIRTILGLPATDDGTNIILQINVLVLKESFIDPGNAPQRGATIPNGAGGNDSRIEIKLIRHGDTPETIYDGKETTWQWNGSVGPEYQNLYYSTHTIRSEGIKNSSTGDFQVYFSNSTFPGKSHHFTATSSDTNEETNCIECIRKSLGQTLKNISIGIQAFSNFLPTADLRQSCNNSSVITYIRFLERTLKDSHLYMTKRMGDSGLGGVFVRLIQEKGIVNFKEIYGTPVCISKDRLAIMFYLLFGINCIKCSVDYSMLSFMTHELNMTITTEQINDMFGSVRQILLSLDIVMPEELNPNDLTIVDYFQHIINNQLRPPEQIREDIVDNVINNEDMKTMINEDYISHINYNEVSRIDGMIFNKEHDQIDTRTIINSALSVEANIYIDEYNQEAQTHYYTKDMLLKESLTCYVKGIFFYF